MLPWTRPVSLVNARVMTAQGPAASVRFGARVLAFDEPPGRGDAVVDLDGAFVLPGLINAHDHLELNHYGALKARERYKNASEWIDDLRVRIRHDQAIRVGRSHPLSARLFVGGLKNLLSGVTTVAHHNPRYRGIDRHVPVRVVQRYGWAHSFAMEAEPVGAHGEPGGGVVSRCIATHRDLPFMVHAAEGVDLAARDELVRLEASGCLRPNTVLVHGVAIDAACWPRIAGYGASLVWCPASNLFLFGRTAPVRRSLDAGASSSVRVCVGTDSRITGARDLLDELRVAREAESVSAGELLRMVTSTAACVLRLTGAGRLEVGGPADLLVIPPFRDTAAEALLATRRRDVRLVTIDGRPAIGTAAMRAVFAARRTGAAPVFVDGIDRLIASPLARRLARCPIVEPGVECAA